MRPKIFIRNTSSRSGQSLMEVLVGVAVGAIFIIGVSTIIAPALQQSKQVIQIQTRTELASELLGNVRSWGQGQWQSLIGLSTSSANHYYLIASTSPFVATSGAETVVVGSSTYTRYFYVDSVYRDGSGNITSTITGMALDPSEMKISVYASSTGNASSSSLFVGYVSRNTNNVTQQTDWSGGTGQSGVITVANSLFSSDVNIDYTLMPGSIRLSVAANVCTM